MHISTQHSLTRTFLMTVIFLCGQVGMADELPEPQLLEATSELQVKVGAEVIATLEKGSRLWAFKKQGDWFWANVPFTPERGWVAAGKVREIDPFQEDAESISIALSEVGKSNEAKSSGEIEIAVDLMQGAIREVTPILGAHGIVATMHSNASSLLFRLERNVEALEHSYSCVAITEGHDGGFDSDTVMRLNNHATLLAKNGKSPAAMEAIKRALKIALDGQTGDSQIAFAILTNLGDLQARLEQNRESRESYLKALELVRKLEDPDSEDYLDLLNSIAGSYDDSGDTAISLLYAEEAVQLANKKFAGKPRQVKALLRMGRSLSAVRRYAEARYFLEQAAAVSADVYGVDHSISAAILNNLGVVCVQLNQFETAANLFYAALNVQAEKLGRVSDTASSAEWLGFTLDEIDGATPDMLELAATSLDTAQEIYGEIGNHQQQATALCHLAEVMFSQDRKDDGFQTFDRAEKIAREQTTNG